MTSTHALKLEEAKYLRLKQELLEQYPDLAEDERALFDTLDGISDLDEFLAAVIRSAREDGAMGQALAGMIEDMKARLKRLDERVAKKRAICAEVMGRIGKKKIELPDMTLSLSAGRPKVVITDPEAIPNDLSRTKVTVEPDKERIAEAMRAGATVPGASWNNPQPVLQVRVR